MSYSYEFHLLYVLKNLLKKKEEIFLCSMFFRDNLLDLEVYNLVLQILHTYLETYLCNELEISLASLTALVESRFNSVTRDEMINCGVYLNDIYSFVYVSFQLMYTYRLLKQEADVFPIEQVLEEYIAEYSYILLRIPTEQNFFFINSKHFNKLIGVLQDALLSSNYFLFKQIELKYIND